MTIFTFWLLAIALPVLALDFTWPAVTKECEVVPLTITGGPSPSTLYIVPIGHPPFVWSLIRPPDGVWYQKTWNIQIQMPQGIWYSVFLSNGTDSGAGTVTPIQQVQPGSSTACLATASQNYTAISFNFKVSGNVSGCQTNLHIDWDGGEQSGARYMTIVPLDSGLSPYRYPLDGYTNGADWMVFMDPGTHFTVMMNDSLGFGDPGVNGVYQVPNTTSGCRTQSTNTSASISQPWPNGLAVIPLSNTPTTTSTPLPTNGQGGFSSLTVAASSSADSSSPSSTETASSNGFNMAALIVGLSVGVTSAIGMAAVVYWYICRKRKQSRNTPKLDLFDAEQDSTEGGNDMTFTNSSPLVTPFQVDRAIIGGDSDPLLPPEGFHAAALGPPTHENPASSKLVIPPDTPVGNLIGHTPDNEQYLQHKANPTVNGHSRFQPSAVRAQRPNVPSIPADNSLVGDKSPLAQEYLNLPTHRRSNSGERLEHPETFNNLGSRSQRDVGAYRSTQVPQPEITYRRHVDAGSIEDEDPEREQHEGGVVDLPPLYDEVARRRVNR